MDKPPSFLDYELLCACVINCGTLGDVITQTIESISYDLGFSAPGSFSRAFKEWTGHPPAAVRRALEKGSEGKS